MVERDVVGDDLLRDAVEVIYWYLGSSSSMTGTEESFVMRELGKSVIVRYNRRVKGE